MKINSNGGEGIFWAKGQFYIKNKSPKVSQFEELIHEMSCLNYSKELWTNEVTYSHLSNIKLWACVVLAFTNFWFITIWQFLNVFWRIMSCIIISNQNRSKILTKWKLCKVLSRPAQRKFSRKQREKIQNIYVILNFPPLDWTLAHQIQSSMLYHYSKLTYLRKLP